MNPSSLTLLRRTQILMAIAVALVSLLGLAMMIAARLESGERSSRDNAQSIAAALLPALNNALVVGDLATVEETLARVVRQEAVRRIVLLGPRDGRMILESHDEDGRHEQAPAWFTALLASPPVRAEADIVAGGIRYGTVQVEMSSRKLLADLWSAIVDFFLAGLAGLVGILALLEWALSRSLAPLETLVAGSRQLAAGRREHIPLSAVPEIAVVADAFNSMADVVTQREAELLSAKNAAEAGARAKAAFLATMSHEIRTPMNGILGMTDLALMTTGLTEEQHGYLELVKDSAASLLAILNDALDYSKIEAGRLTIEAVPLSVEEIARQVVALLAVQLRGSQVDLRCEIDAALPHILVGDPLRLRQVLSNLVANAVKFTHEGEIVVRVALLGQEEDGCRVEISVSDTGIGIAADKLETIFDPFTQAEDHTTRRYGGTGLGLAICHQLVQLMGGRITVDSQPGHGSVFRCVLPFGLPADDASSPAPPLRADGPSPPCD